MNKVFTTVDKEGFDWIDLLDPTAEDLATLSEKFSLRPLSVKHSLETDNLPKFEHLNGHTFAIVRVYTGALDSQSDTLQELTDRIALFVGEKFILTIHKNECGLLDQVYQEHLKQGDCPEVTSLFNQIVKAALQSYDEPARKLTRTIEYYENQVFLKDRKAPFIKGLYFLKRKVDVILRVLLLSYDIVDNIDASGKGDENTRDVRDLYVKQQTLYDSMASNTNHLLNIYFNVSAQKTNETIRVLTIFSVFFLPLTFIVGVYGMNFHFMPELHWKYGYPLSLLLMGVVVLAIWLWFRRKKWL